MSESESFASSGRSVGGPFVRVARFVRRGSITPGGQPVPSPGPGTLLSLYIRVHRLVLDTTLHCAITWDQSHSGNAIEWDQLQAYGVPRQNSGADDTGFDFFFWDVDSSRSNETY